MLSLPESCPECGERKWRVTDNEANELFIDLEKNETVPRGTLIRQIVCAECGYVDLEYQKP